MIDVENEIITLVTNKLKDTLDEIYVDNNNEFLNPKFPLVTIEEMDNSVYIPTMTNEGEIHSRLMYDINVYSNKSTGKKQECKKISKIINDEISRIGMVRTAHRPLTNLEDKHIYRLFSRYTTTINKDKKTYRG